MGLFVSMIRPTITLNFHEYNIIRHVHYIFQYTCMYAQLNHTYQVHLPFSSSPEIGKGAQLRK